MPTRKKYTNVTFTKRVDHEAGRHRTRRSPSEPAVCKSCGAIYAHRRWTLASDSVDLVRRRAAKRILCPACKQGDSNPSGFVYLKGKFLQTHRDEILRLLTNEAERVLQDNPLARIVAWEERASDDLTLKTTTEHLAQRLGHALEKAFGGDVRYDFSHENKLARVFWQRNS
jgi:hypothetical protein